MTGSWMGLALALTAAPVGAAELTIARSGDAGFAIGLPAEPTTVQRTAAGELSYYFQRIVGVEVPVVEGEVPTKGVVLAHGDGTLGTDGYRLVARDGRLEICADGIHGHLFGAYGLLEDYAGVEWLASYLTNVPVRAEIAVPAGLDRTEKPAFELRDLGEYDVTRHVEFAAHLRLHGRHFHFGPKYGNDAFRMDSVLGNSHTFGRMFPVEKYFKEHPEWFSQVKGKRIDLQPQLCLTNEELAQRAIEFVLARMRANPGVKYFGVSQNDWPNCCECARCQALAEREGSQAAPVIAFVNRIAEAVEQADPTVTITTLAYQWSRKPPRTLRPRANVVVVLCDIECDMSRPLATSRSDRNQKFLDDLEGWGRLTRRIYLWDYFVNYVAYPHPFPDLDSLAPNLRTFRDNGVTQVYEEGDNQGPHSDSAPLKAWLLAHLMWNPDQDVDRLIERFITGYYGAAAPWVRKYYKGYRRINKFRDEGALPMYCFEPIQLAPTPVGFYDRGSELWAQAQAAVAGDAVRERACRWGRFSCDYSRALLFAQSPEGAVVALTRDPSRFGGADAETARAAASRVLRLLAEEPDTVVEISCSGRPQSILRTLVGREWPPKDATRAVLDAKHVKVSFSPERYTMVETAGSLSGSAVSINPRRDCSGIQYLFSEAYVEPGAKIGVRVRLKVRPLANGRPDQEVFAAAIDAPNTGRPTSRFSLRAQDILPDEWHWYDLGTVSVVDAKSRFWCGLNGEAEHPVAESVLFDAVEFSLK